MRHIFMFIALIACTDSTSSSNSASNGGGSNAAQTELAPPRPPDEQFASNLSEGAILSDLSWAAQSTVACWVGSENSNFNGRHVFFEINQARGTDITLEVRPDSGVDVSLYAIQFSDRLQYPPDITSIWECEAGFDAAGDNNPGENEALFLQNYQDYSVLIGVAGANNATTGAFTLDVWYDTGAVLDTQ